MRLCVCVCVRESEYAGCVSVCVLKVTRKMLNEVF